MHALSSKVQGTDHWKLLNIQGKLSGFPASWRSNKLPTVHTNLEIFSLQSAQCIPTHHQAGFFESYQDSRARIFSRNSSFIVSHHSSFSIKKCSSSCSVSLAKHGTLRKRHSVITQHGLRLPLGGMKPTWKLWHRVSELHCICTKIDRHCAYNYWTQQHDGHLIRFSGI